MIAILLRFAPWLMKAAPFLGLLRAKGKAIAAVLSVVSLLATAGYIWVLNNKIERMELEAVLVVSQLSQCQSVNSVNLSTILSLESANESLAKAIEITDKERIKAITEAAERDAQSASALNSSITELERLRNANPTCEKISSIDIGAACPLIVRKLREHAAGTVGRD